MPATEPRVIVALDFPRVESALDLLGRLDPGRCRVKIGKELFTRAGPALVERVVRDGFDVFLDLKFHDIPNTVAAACAAAADLGVWMVNVHASGGPAMLAAARARLDQLDQPPLLIAVTVLTSLDAADLAAVGCPGEPADRVLQLARLAQTAGLDGIVCSPREAGGVREALGPAFRLVTPGVRPASAAQGDQKRVMTPAQAVAAGADFLVVGRPVTGAADPMAALSAIEAELASVGPAGDRSVSPAAS
ncbi:orotidine-5'-phosphate decarboxylase [Thiohalocapsa marina]|uniref:Orotidine 5'-phosphate decarboxylase n=1 Tax=Thiohalocapsa marina TaxID=424902 RepID=A0A5M8FLD8_9GAMM|nr:orotidine-5'-phosphate decarboxylase [Thiohalocapsa marina]KAA6185658.1 orotidine-5'-phosphate decarboxylase [Thiohalocapsa marina]